VHDHKRQLAGLRVALLSAGGPVTASWLRAARVLQLDLTCICPPGHEPDITTVGACSMACSFVLPAVAASQTIVHYVCQLLVQSDGFVLCQQRVRRDGGSCHETY
jgi:ornithine carbamoyltransferase